MKYESDRKALHQVSETMFLKSSVGKLLPNVFVPGTTTKENGQ
jgi:hypothetical protein